MLPRLLPNVFQVDDFEAVEAGRIVSRPTVAGIGRPREN